MLRLARDAARLPGADRRLALRALFWLAIVRVAVRTCPYPRVRRMLDRIPVRSRRTVAAAPLQCAAAIRRAARVMPSSTCLAQSIAGAALLRREGRSCVLSLHVAFDPQHRFEAHASLLADGVLVAGGGAAAGWTVLASDQLRP